MALAGLLSLLGCASNPSAQVEYVREKPSPELLADCSVPVIQVSTNGELARTVKALAWALKLCNDDKADLRKWAGD